MTTIVELPGLQGKRVCGTYRILKAQGAGQAKQGSLGASFRIADFTGECDLLLQDSSGDPLTLLRSGSLARIDLLPEVCDQGLLVARAHAFRLLTTDELANAARAIPASACPDKALPALEELVQHIEALTVVPVKRCINRLVDQYHLQLISAKGSWRHHHSYDGGLLVHTVAVMRVAAWLGSYVYPRDRPRVELIMLAAFLHDLGKARSHCSQPGGNPSRYMRHEIMSVIMADAAIEALRRDWATGAAAVSRIMAWLCESPAYREKGEGVDGELVHMADVIDVKHDRYRPYQPMRKPGERADASERGII